MGSGLTDPNFTAQVDLAATQIFSKPYPTKATGSSASVAAPTYLDGYPGKAINSFFILMHLCCAQSLAAVNQMSNDIVALLWD